MNGSAIAYFFKGSDYVRYDIAKDVIWGPKKISDYWPALPSTSQSNFQSGFDAAVNWGNGFAYFFKGSDYVKYNIALDTASNILKISDYWPALPSSFHSGITSAINWGNGFAYFFKGPDYVKYDIKHDTASGALKISDYWPALPSTSQSNFQSGFDAAVNWGNGFAYFFKGSDYVKYDIKHDTASGALKISDYWPALPSSFHSDIKSAINWTFPLNLAELMKAADLTVVEEGNWKTHNHGILTPVGIIMHHTAGNAPSDLSVVINGRPGLPGPLANFYVDRGGSIHIVSDGLANHAGDGVPSVLNDVNNDIAPTGSASALGLHTQTGFSGNKLFFGFENENLGDGIQLWPAVQLDTMALASAALCRVHGWDETRIIGHLEWTERKIDPNGFTMSDFRNQVSSILYPT